MIEAISKFDWLNHMKNTWRQGEHVAIIGPTGTGKTRIAAQLVPIRDYVAVVAVKRKDESVATFKRYGFHVISKWKPEYYQHKVVLWIKPDSLEIEDLDKQAAEIHRALSDMYIAGGWCICLDEAGYLAGELGLGHAMGVLLNQGRSSHITVVACMTRPTSLIARVPKEALSQPRHKIVFRYDNEDELKACAKVCDMPVSKLSLAMRELDTNPNGGHTDFLYVSSNRIAKVINTR